MADLQDPRVWRRSMAGRLLVLAAIFSVCVVALVARLVFLQVLRHDDYLARSHSQQFRLMKIPAERGEIVDRFGKILATTVEEATVCAEPKAIADARKTAAQLCRALDDCDAAREAELLKNLTKKAYSVYLARQVSAEEARRVMALRIEGIFLTKEPRRWYPNRELAAQVLGFVGVDHKGLAGIEATYDSLLAGTASTVLLEMAAGKRGQKPFNRVGDPAVPGRTIELTIDVNLQHLAERELREAVLENRALAGSVLILDPYTGEILAMASYPLVNANVFGNAPVESRLNRPVQNTYEPGSTFKIVTASAALQEKVMRPTDLVDTGNGVLRIGGRVIDEYKQHAYGTLSFTDVIVRSSNIGAVKIGWQVGAATLGRYVSLFGFGARLSPDFPSESAGLVWRPTGWNDSVVASVSMGYQVGVTALQMAAAASVVANGGELVQPRVVRAIIDGNRRQVVPRKVLRRVISPETAAELTTIMEGVVERGTAKNAALKDFTVAGKTGTSNKNDGHRYIEEYNTSFVGFVPSRAPALTIIVHIDSPKGPVIAGGAVAAPVFHRIADAALRYLGVPPTVNPTAPVLVARGDSNSRIEVAAPALPVTIVPVSSLVSSGQIVLPDLRGLSGREAARVLARLGITPRMNGDGVVIDQDPAPNTPVDIGGTCRLALARAIPGFLQ
jgi:cell division protein FtsI (penicillin-binding protein 3)